MGALGACNFRSDQADDFKFTKLIFISYFMCVQNFNSIRPFLHTFFNVHTQFYGMGASGACNFRSIEASDLKIGRYHHQHLFNVCAKFQVHTTISSYFFTCAHTDTRTHGHTEVMN